jgi:hypothetical protein
MVYYGMGMVWENLTCGIPVLNSINSKRKAFGPPLMGLREGLRARKEGRMGLGRYWRGRKGYGTPGEYNHPLPPYQLTPNLHPLLVYSRRGCCKDTATLFSTSCKDGA